jgi:hypothetical protein
VLIDFGASRPHGAGAASQMTSIISAGYSPFEQYGGSRQGPWTDLYALAGTAYRIIAGQAPTDAIARQQGQTLPPAVDVGRGRYSERLLAAIDRTLALDPAARPQSAAELRALIRGETYRAGRAASADGAWDPHATQVNRDSPRHTRDSARPRRRMLAVVATLVMATAGAGAWYGWSWYHHTAPDAVIADAPALDQAPADEPVDEDTAPDAEAVAADADRAPVPLSEPEQVAAIEPELMLLSGLDMPDAVREYRIGQIAGALLAYVSNKERFEACVDSGCPDQLALMARVQEAQQGYAWERAPFAGTLRIANPRWLPDSDNCPHLIDVHEQIETASLRRSQVRTYCTRNGFDRVLQTAGAVDDAFR